MENSLENGVREYYNRTAQEWADQGYADNAKMQFIKPFLAELPNRPRILDLCCGAGYDSQRLAALGAQVVGIDLSEESLSIAREHNPNLDFYLGDMLDDYCYIGKVDGILCSAGLVHLPAEQLPLAFHRMAAVMEKGGGLLLIVRDGEGRVEKFSNVTVDGEKYDRAFYAHTLDELEAAASGMFAFSKELERGIPPIWRNYIFKRI